MEDIVGKKIVGLRHLTKKELASNGWSSLGNCVALILEGDTIVYPSKDEEGNTPGCIFIKDSQGEITSLC